MKSDRIDLIKFAFVTALVIVGWLALASVSANIYVRMLLGWVGLAFVAFYWRWLTRHKIVQKSRRDARE